MTTTLDQMRREKLLDLAEEVIRRRSDVSMMRDLLDEAGLTEHQVLAHHVVNNVFSSRGDWYVNLPYGNRLLTIRLRREGDTFRPEHVGGGSGDYVSPVVEPDMLRQAVSYIIKGALVQARHYHNLHNTLQEGEGT